ncbi:hypothetical protein L226DRAFT_306472 [Lentinus tigrinus ALCF2SS1-7]|uniref:uncharacterized protein n=1 Tax=Lentinus tigrinus ALCF2SS1-7 TaxID=1328758 RepID=UPI001165D6C8|nr:hypothetical protein L226DRAFT_306472 [Lentinus tigrinus ALCF2SS1-7]
MTNLPSTAEENETLSARTTEGISSMGPTNSPAPSGGADVADVAIPPERSSPTKQRREIVKMPLMKFKLGGTLARDMLPAIVLPRPLNPVYVECNDVRDIPTAWYGIPWDKEALIKYAAKRGWAVLFNKSKDPADAVPGVYDIVRTWSRLSRRYYARHGIAMRIRDVWGASYREGRHVLQQPGDAQSYEEATIHSL